jgi:toxin ParE1/3/4
MKYVLRLTEEAENDLLDIHAYVAANDSPNKADELLDKLEEKCLSLENLPTRGHVPPELVPTGARQYLEVHLKPYRILYEVVGRHVCILAVWDGRRDVAALLERRLLR